MIGLIEAFMTEDHNRLDRLLEASDEGGVIDEASYAEMRRGLLRHIALEEKILLLDARARREGVPLPLAAQLRREHGQIAHALVAPPSLSGCIGLRLLLAAHNPLEEGVSGLYATCDRLAGHEADGVVAKLRAYPEVPVAPYYAGPRLVV